MVVFSAENRHQKSHSLLLSSFVDGGKTRLFYVFSYSLVHDTGRIASLCASSSSAIFPLPLESQPAAEYSR